MKSSQCFALIVDETKDLSKMEQLSVVVRYYLNGAVFGRFLGFRNAEQLDAKSLLSYVKETLNRCGIDSQLCIAQTYDGASVMSGTSRGVQALFRQEVPQAVYVHCMNHRLNLVIVDVCKAIKPRSHRYKQQAGNGSRGLFTKLLSRLKVFSDILQSKDCNLSQACLMAHTVIDELSEIRNSHSAFDTVWEQTCTISEENGVPQREKQRTKRLPLHLEQFVLSEGRPVEEESPDSKETFRVKVFLPVLDHLIVELTRRFAENNDVLCGVSALHPQSENFMDVSLLKPFAEHYACDINSVEVECKLSPYNRDVSTGDLFLFPKLKMIGKPKILPFQRCPRSPTGCCSLKEATAADFKEAPASLELRWRRSSNSQRDPSGTGQTGGSTLSASQAGSKKGASKKGAKKEMPEKKDEPPMEVLYTAKDLRHVLELVRC
ncbi:hypothetical protein HPB50_010162 [Hyalomma asiaticum]|uniref:Uncharacterized protein n=1 Tax=Hyalomma asiaticum TaxID=266040 RepID=A0ACB7SZC6_HYAAI|nr:hypothetical protein HPB50_010162 [Hyalomma asiaticum]